MTEAACVNAGGVWAAKPSPEDPCPGCIGCCCAPGSSEPTEATEAECTDLGGTWLPKSAPEDPCPPCPYKHCCQTEDGCVQADGCNDELGKFIGTITIEWCCQTYTFSWPETYELAGYCNWAMGPEEGCLTGYTDLSCTNICWFGENKTMTYEEERAQIFVTSDCYTDECTGKPRLGPCRPCERLRFVIGVNLRGVLFFDGFPGGFDYATGGSEVWLFTQDLCGNTSLTLLSKDMCIKCGLTGDACVGLVDTCTQDTNPIRPSFGNLCGNTPPEVTINEAP